MAINATAPLLTLGAHFSINANIPIRMPNAAVALARRFGSSTDKVETATARTPIATTMITRLFLTF